MDFDRSLKRLKTSSSSLGLDLISLLPHDVATNILSRLDTCSAIRISVLSHRWLELWKSTPLNLDDSEFGETDLQLRCKMAKRLIDFHPGPVGRVSLTIPNCGPLFKDLQASFMKPMFDGLGVLILDFHVKWIMHDRKQLPTSILRFHSVRVLHLSCCMVDQHTVINSPCLVDLELRWVRISQEAIQKVLKGCTKIEKLALLWNSGYRALSLNSLHKLQSLFVRLNADDNHDEVELENLEIGTSESLKQLYINQRAFGPSVMIPAGTNIQMLGYFGLETPRLQIGHTIFQQSVSSRLVDYFPSVRIFALKMLQRDEHGPEHISDFLYCFPCLEVLHIIFVDDILSYCYPQLRSVGDGSIYNSHGAIECFEHTLRTVALWNFPKENDGDIETVPMVISNYFVERDLALDNLVLGACMKLDIKSIENECANNYRQRRTRPFKFFLAVMHEGDLKHMRQGDPFSLLGDVYHEILVTPHDSDEHDDSKDGDGDERDEETNRLLDADDDRNHIETDGGEGSSDGQSSAPGAFVSEREGGNVEYVKKEELLSKSEDDNKLSVQPVECEHFLNNEEIPFEARQDFKGKDNTQSQLEVSSSEKIANMVEDLLNNESSATNKFRGMFGIGSDNIEMFFRDHFEALKNRMFRTTSPPDSTGSSVVYLKSGFAVNRDRAR